mgnify:FL=1
MVLDDKRKSRLPRGVILIRSQLWEGSSALIEVSVFNIFFSHSFHILFLTDQMKVFVSIFPLLGRYKRRISMVFQPELKTRDKQRFPILHKQHVRLPILHNLELHKSRMRKTDLNLYLTEPLWRNIEHVRIKGKHDRLIVGILSPFTA